MKKGHDDDYNKLNISGEQLWHVHSGKSSHCEIVEMIIRDPRFSSLIYHDKNHILWQYRWQGLSCFAIIESILYPCCERL
jgi:hypothetical protein